MPQGDMFRTFSQAIPSARRPYWHPENMQALQHYMALAATSLQEGDRERAIECWEVALGRCPTLPVPRRQRLVQLIVTAWHEEARGALGQTMPDYRRAIACLRRGWRTLEQNPYPVGISRTGLSGMTLRGETARILGFLLHLEGKYDEALSLYEATDATPQGQVAHELRYAGALVRLQAARLFDVSSWVRSDDAFSAGAAPLQKPARQRLTAFAKLFIDGATRSAAEAQVLFPSPETPRLPLQWALEGALLAALNEEPEDCVAFYRIAFTQPRVALSDVHRYVFLTLAGRDDAPVGIEKWNEDVLLSWVIPADGNERPFPDRASFEKWRDAVMMWRRRVWLARARAALVAGQHEALRQCVDAAIRSRPRDRLSRHLRLWLACTDTDRMWSLRGRWDTRDVTLLRLSVLAAERWEATEQVISRLQHLLQRFPDDAWGLARWRQWMNWLGEHALSEGHHRQALLQFASLLMHRPDDESGWNGCGRAHAAAGNGKRAEDCFAEARRIARAAGSRTATPWAASRPATPDETFMAAANDVLSEMLREADDVPVSVPRCPVSPRALREELWKSLRTHDVYLRTFIERWAEIPGSERTNG